MLPWTAVESVPLVQNMVPSRLAVFTALFAGLLLAAAVDGLWGRGWLGLAGPGRRDRAGDPGRAGPAGAVPGQAGGGHAAVLHRGGRPRPAA
jgi:hypothetical protein